MTSSLEGLRVRPKQTIPSSPSTSLEGLRVKSKVASPSSEAPSFTLWDRAKQLGSGIADGVQQTIHSGLSLNPDQSPSSRSLPFGSGEDILSFPTNTEAHQRHTQTMKQGQDILTRERDNKRRSLDSFGRILHSGGDFVGSGLNMPFGGTPAAPSRFLNPFVKTLGKHFAKDAGIGATSGVLQEGGVNPLVADLTASIFNPTAAGVAKTGKNVIQHITAPREQKAATKLHKIYRKFAPDLTESRSADQAFDVSATLDDFDPRTTPTEAGTALRNTLEHSLEKRKAFREEHTQPLYEAVKQNTDGLPLPQTNALLDDLFSSSRGDTRKAVQNIQRELSFSNKRLTPQELANREHVEKYLQDNPNVTLSPTFMAELKKLYPYPHHAPTAYEINQVISQVIDPLLHTKDASLKRTVKGIKESLLAETDAVPELKEARDAYHTLSKPVNKIDRHPLLKHAVQKDTYGAHRFMEADLPAKIIAPSLESVPHAHHLLDEIKKHKPTLQATQSAIHRQFMDTVTDTYGKVSYAKVIQWQRKNPGAFVIDPSLATKVKSLANSQFFVDQARTKINNSLLKDTFTHFGLKTGANLLPPFPGKDTLMEALSTQMSKELHDKDELIQNVIRSPEFKALLNTKASDKGKITKLMTTLLPSLRNVLVSGQKTERPVGG